MMRRGPLAGSTVVGADEVFAGAGLDGVVVLLVVVPGLVRVVRGVPGRLMRAVVTGLGASTVVAGVSTGFDVSVFGVTFAGVSVLAVGVGSGSSSAMRAPVAVTRLPVPVDEMVGAATSGSGT